MNQRRTKIALKRVIEGGEIVFRVENRRWMRTRVTELRIGARGLEATGDLGGHGDGTLLLSWERVMELHYGPLGRGAVGGLYAREGEWCSRCVLPWVSEEQADEMIAAIAKRFPQMAQSPTSALEIAIGEAIFQKTLVRRKWLPSFGRRGVAAVAR